MAYIDTSVLVAYYCPEPLSHKAEAALGAQTELVLSSLTEVEFFSAISKKIREKELARPDGEKIVAKFQSHLGSQYFRILTPHVSHFQLAREWIGRFTSPLRTLDALHLALAAIEELPLLTADSLLAKSAKKFGVKALFLSTSR